MILLLVTLTEVEFLVWMGKRGCGQPILTRVLWMGTIFLAQMKRPEISDSLAEEVMNLMIYAMVRIGPLKWGEGRLWR